MQTQGVDPRTHEIIANGHNDNLLSLSSGRQGLLLSSRGADDIVRFSETEMAEYYTTERAGKRYSLQSYGMRNNILMDYRILCDYDAAVTVPIMVRIVWLLCFCPHTIDQCGSVHAWMVSGNLAPKMWELNDWPQ